MNDANDGPGDGATDAPSDGPHDGSIEGAINGALRRTGDPSWSASLGTRLFATTARAVASLAVTFVVGGATGAALLHKWSPPRERVVYVDRPARSASTTSARSEKQDTPSTGESAQEVAAPPGTDVPSSPHRAASSNQAPAGASSSARGSTGASARGPVSAEAAGAGSSVSDLEMEQKLLDIARTALSRGQASDALSPLDRHAQRYPKGVLAEEREALAVNALVTLGRHDEARQRGARFLRRYPDSLLRASVEAAVAAIP